MVTMLAAAPRLTHNALKQGGVSPVTASPYHPAAP